MDFSNRGVQPQPVAPAAHPAGAATSNKRAKEGNKLTRWSSSLLGGAVIILLVALVAAISFGGNNSSSKYVDSNKLQAVFLNTGQVYFGNIKSLNNNYYVLTNIYYLQTSNSGSSSSTANSNTSVSLVKLGCELHEPYDQMVINADQVTFWENLQDNGQVAKAVATFQKDNPNGQKCSDQSSASSTNSGSNVQNAGTNNTGSNSTDTNTTQ